MKQNKEQNEQAKPEDIVFGEAELNGIIDVILTKQVDAGFSPSWAAKQSALAVARIARLFQMPEANIQSFHKAIQLHTVCGNASGMQGWLKSDGGGNRIGAAVAKAGEEQA